MVISRRTADGVRQAIGMQLPQGGKDAIGQRNPNIAIIPNQAASSAHFVVQIDETGRLPGITGTM
jgi:hypothetical protein